MKIKLTTISPIHVGTGKEIAPTDFYNNYRISFDKLCDYLYDKVGDPFIEYLSDEYNLATISVNNLISKFKLSADEIIKNCALYRLNTRLTKNTRELIKINGLAYIPGSSLKGAIRTALLYKVLKNDNEFLSNYLNNIRQKIAKSRANQFDKLMKNLDQELIEKAFHYGVKKPNGEIIQNEQQFDLLKLLYISDSNNLEIENNCDVAEIKVYALKKNKPHLNFYIFAECIMPMVDLEFDIRFNLDFVKQLAREFKNPKSKVGHDIFINADEKLRMLFGIDLNSINNYDEEEIIKSIFNDVINFGKEVSKIEKKFVDELSDKNDFKRLEKIYTFDKKFKLGFGSGFHAMTIFSLFCNNEALKSRAEEIYRKLRIGEHRNGKPMDIDNFPFTRKLKHNTPIDALGWVTLSQYIDDFKKNNSNSLSQSEQIASTSSKSTISSSTSQFNIAVITDAKSKPPKVKLLTGEFQGEETILPQVRLEGLGLTEGSKIYVKLITQGKKVQKAEFKGKVD